MFRQRLILLFGFQRTMMWESRGWIPFLCPSVRPAADVTGREGGTGGEKSKKDPVMKNLHITPPAAARDFEIPPIVRGGGDSSPYAKIPT